MPAFTVAYTSTLSEHTNVTRPPPPAPGYCQAPLGSAMAACFDIH